MTAQPITVDDVIWSFNVLKKQSPLYNQYYRQRDRRPRPTATARSTSPSTRRAIANCRRSWATSSCCRSTGGRARTPAASKRDITRADAGAAARLGPLQDRELQAGRRDRLGARARLLGRGPADVNVGRNNFDKRRYVYFLDDNAEWQAFTKGGFEDIRPENRSRALGDGLRFPGVQAGDVMQEGVRQHIGRAACRASSSTRAGRSSRTAGCARR